jgi:hypothetical protein
MVLRHKVRFYNYHLLVMLFSGILFQLQGQITSGLLKYESTTTDAYILFSPTSSRQTFLMDKCGFVVHRWQSQYFPGQNVHLLEDGKLLRACRIGGAFTTGGIGGRVEITSWEGDLWWAADFANDSIHQHHVVHPMPNGNILVLLYQLKRAEEAIQAGFRPDLVPAQGIWTEKIMEIRPSGAQNYEVVWEWNMWDHLIQDFDATKENFGNISFNPGRMDVNYRDDGAPNPSDWLHFNSLDYHPVKDQILISSRHHSEVYVIDHSTTTSEARGNTGGRYGKGGDFLYRFGNPAAHRKNNTADRYFYGQHDAQWIQKTGHEDAMMVFNNGISRTPEPFSEIFIWQPAYDSNGGYIIRDGFFGLAEILRQYRANPPTSLYSARLSGVGLLQNGNLLICEGNKGKMSEVDSNDQVVWEFVNPVNNFGVVPQGTVPQSNDLFTAKSYAKYYKAFSGKALTRPALPLIPSPATDECVRSTSSIEQGSKDPKHWVRVDIENALIHLSPDLPEGIEFGLFDAAGRLVRLGRWYHADKTLDISNLHSGVYFIRFSDFERKLKISSLVIKI